MDALVDYALIDIGPESEGSPSNCQPQSPSNGSGENGCHAQLVRDLKLAVEQSLEKFEGRIAARMAGEVHQQSQSESPSQFHAEQLVHENVFCDHCNAVIVGVRYKCGMCQDYDLCERCESQRPHQQRNHLFVKIYEPLSASLNQQPLLPSDLGATNPFLTLLGSLGLPAGTEATLEVQAHEGPLEVRELAQANGCQFYLREGGRQVCKDYQLVNRSGRDIQAGDYCLEHVFSTGLFPIDAKLPIPEIPEGDVRIMCIAWQLPHQQLMSSVEDDRPMRQATSVYRIKDRQGRRLGELIKTSLAMRLPMSTHHQSQRPAETKSADAQTVNGFADDSFERIELFGDDKLPSCFVLTSPTPTRPSSPPRQLITEDVVCVSGADAADANMGCPRCSGELTAELAPPPPPSPPPPPPPSPPPPLPSRVSFSVHRKWHRQSHVTATASAPTPSAVATDAGVFFAPVGSPALAKSQNMQLPSQAQSCSSRPDPETEVTGQLRLLIGSWSNSNSN